jgi:hypothetical protein
VFTSPFNAIEETYAALREFKDSATLLQIVTSLRIYEDMLIERVSLPRNAGDAGVSFGIDVRQLRIVQSGLVAAPPLPAIPAGLPETSKGAQGAKPPDGGEDAVKPASLALQALQGLGVL